MRGVPGFFALALVSCSRPQQVAKLGDVRLQSGEVLRDCRIPYRTFGTLDARRSNAVLFIPWAMGTARDLEPHIGEGKLVDSTRDYVIAMDVLGDGVASSPSNSKEQPGQAFPRFTIGDMVETEYQALTRVLGISHLRAVVGISGGGMQVFQWAVAHPQFADFAVSIAGSPRSTKKDGERWEGLTRKLLAEPRWRRWGRALLQVRPRAVIHELSLDPDDFDRQAGAIVSLDVSSAFGGSIERAAAAVRAKMLVVVSAQDEVVDPGPAKEFARLAGARLVELDGRCGHLATQCEEKALRAAVSRFLAGE